MLLSVAREAEFVQGTLPVALEPGRREVRGRQPDAKALGISLAELYHREREAEIARWTAWGFSLEEVVDFCFTHLDHPLVYGKDKFWQVMNRAWETGGIEGLRHFLQQHQCGVQKRQEGRSCERLSYSVRWTNPYKEPPSGKPVVLLEVEVSERSWKRQPARLQAKVDAILDRNPGYNLCFSCTATVPAKRWTDERKSAHRRRLMESRVRRNYSLPALAEEEIARQLAAKPEYFGLVPLMLPEFRTTEPCALADSPAAMEVFR